MKIIINYDFFDKVLDTRENLNVFKVIRNNKKSYIIFCLPTFLAANILITDDIKKSILSLPIEYMTTISLDLIEQKIKKGDEYKTDAIFKLKKGHKLVYSNI